MGNQLTLSQCQRYDLSKAIDILNLEKLHRNKRGFRVNCVDEKGHNHQHHSHQGEPSLCQASYSSILVTKSQLNSHFRDDVNLHCEGAGEQGHYHVQSEGEHNCHHHGHPQDALSANTPQHSLHESLSTASLHNRITGLHCIRDGYTHLHAPGQHQLLISKQLARAYMALKFCCTISPFLP